MQLLGCCMTRDIIADIENCRRAATQKEIIHFAKVFEVSACDFF
jgi:hypothetical protein